MPDANSAAAEQPVWDWLDARSVPFRETTAWWVQRFGARREWLLQRDVCRQNGGYDLVSHQLDRPGFELARESGPPAPPTRLVVRVLTLPNYAAAIGAAAAEVTAEIGDPDPEHDYPSSKLWTRGLAQIQLRGSNHPTRYADESLARYAARVASQASILVNPGVVETLTPTELAIVQRAAPFTDSSGAVGAEAWPWPAGLSSAVRRRRARGLAQRALLFDSPSATLVALRDDDVLWLPAREACAVRVLNTLPAKGGGYAMLGFDLAARLETDDPAPETWSPDTGYVVGGYHVPHHGLDALAQSLGQVLDAPVETRETFNA